MSLKPVRTLPLGWELEIERMMSSLDSKKVNLSSSDDFKHEEQLAFRAVKLGFHLAVRERDSLLKQYETICSIQKGMKPDESTESSLDHSHDPTLSESTSDHIPPPLHIAAGINSLNMSSPKLNNRENELNSTRHTNSFLSDSSKPIPSPKFHQPFNAMSEMYIEPVVEEEGDGRTTWEYLTVTLNRVPGYGFGIAVSGGQDNPHFRSGEPSIVVSDVLRAGPAWGQLQINDRIAFANGVNLENADYSAAVQIMKESDQLNMIIKRRVPLPTLEFEQRTLKFTLTKSRRKDNFGIVLGCKFYIRDITNPKLAEKDPGLRENDTVLRINGHSCEELTLPEACKLLDKSKDKLSLVVQRDVPRGTNWKWGSQTTLYERLGSVSVAETPRDSPRASPVITNRFSSSEGQEPSRLNNAPRVGSRYGRMASSDYVNTLQSSSTVASTSTSLTAGRHSYGGSSPQPSTSRPRTPRDSSNDEYGAYGVPKSMPPSSPPHFPVSPAPFPTDENYLTTVPASDTSPVSHKPPIPAGLPEPRAVSFRKESGSVGVRVIGGNEVGIFVSAVQNGSPAANKGVRPGDKILEVNGREMRGVTREEAVLFLLGLQETVDLVLQFRKDEYERVRAQNLGDNFYIRVHFDHDKPEQQGEIAFRRGDIFQVSDTLFGGTVGSWQATKLSSPSSPDRPEAAQPKGVIPNASRAEKLASVDAYRLSRTLSTEQQRTGTFFKRKFGSGVGRRSKSLNKNHWDEVIFGQGNVNFPAYERVKLKHPGFLRPVVLFGPLADIARDLLLKDFPLRFATPVPEGVPSATDANKNMSGIVRLSSIREIMVKNKHCLLDATPSSVEKLQYTQYCPVVIFVNVDSRSRLRDLRSKLGYKASISTKKLIDQATRINKHYSHLFSATLDATKEDQWFEALRELISHLQERRVWMSEQRPTDLLDDDFLFPMSASRYGTYMGDSSDVESLKGDYSSEIGVSPKLRQSAAESLGDSTYENSRVINDRSEANKYVNGPMVQRQYRMARVPAPGGVYGEIGSSSAYRALYNGSVVSANNAVYLRSMVPNGDGHQMYANHQSMVSHLATLRRPWKPANAPPKPKPKPALRLSATSNGDGCYIEPIPQPPKPNLDTLPLEKPVSPNQVPEPENTKSDEAEFSSSPISGASTIEGTISKRECSTADNQSTVEKTATALNSFVQAPEARVQSPRSGSRNSPSRHFSEPGYYDVKQILADNSSDYEERHSPSPRATAAPTNGYFQFPSSAISDYYSRQMSDPQSGPPRSPAHTGPPRSPAHGFHDQNQRPMNGPMYPRAFHGGQGPQPRHMVPAMINPAFRDKDQMNPQSPYHLQQSRMANYPPVGYQVPAVIRPSRTQSIPAGTNPQLRAGPRVMLTPSKSTVPPPAPAPKSRMNPPVQSTNQTPLNSSNTGFSSDNSASPQPQELRSSLVRVSSLEECTPSPPLKSSAISTSPTNNLDANYNETNNVSVTVKESPRKPPVPAKPANLSSGSDAIPREEQNGSLFEHCNNRPRENGFSESMNENETNDDDLLKHTVIAHVSGVFDSTGGDLISPETGVSVHIPSGALPIGAQQEIYFKVCRDTTMAPPLDSEKGETLLSPLVMCGPQGLKFEKPVELRLPHSASGVNSEQWSFALKSASGAESEWKQVSLADESGTGKLNDNFVSVMIDHF